MNVIAPELRRIDEAGAIPHVSAKLGDAEVKVYCASHRIEATATSPDGIFLLAELYIAAAREAKLMWSELLVSPL